MITAYLLGELSDAEQEAMEVRYFTDDALFEQLLAIETDGYRWHAGKARWQKDLSRRNRLTVVEWRVMHRHARESRFNPYGRRHSLP